MEGLECVSSLSFPVSASFSFPPSFPASHDHLHHGIEVRAGLGQATCASERGMVEITEWGRSVCWGERRKRRRRRREEDGRKMVEGEEKMVEGPSKNIKPFLFDSRHVNIHLHLCTNTFTHTHMNTQTNVHERALAKRNVQFQLPKNISAKRKFTRWSCGETWMNGQKSEMRIFLVLCLILMVGLFQV